MKNENGSTAAIASETRKPLMISGTSGPRMLVRKEITKNIRNTSHTTNRLEVVDMVWRVFSVIIRYP